MRTDIVKGALMTFPFAPRCRSEALLAALMQDSIILRFDALNFLIQHRPFFHILF